MKQGIDLIGEERQRHLNGEGWTLERDLQYTNFELSTAACCYGQMGAGGAFSHPTRGQPPESWPWSQEWWKPSEDPVRNLAKAGALIAAEIDRLLAEREGRRSTGGNARTAIVAPFKRAWNYFAKYLDAHVWPWFAVLGVAASFAVWSCGSFAVASITRNGHAEAVYHSARAELHAAAAAVPESLTKVAVVGAADDCISTLTTPDRLSAERSAASVVASCLAATATKRPTLQPTADAIYLSLVKRGRGAQ